MTRDVNDAHREGVAPSRATETRRAPGLQALYEAEQHLHDADAARSAIQRALHRDAGTVRALMDLPGRERERLLGLLRTIHGCGPLIGSIRDACRSEAREAGARAEVVATRTGASHVSRMATGQPDVDALVIPAGYDVGVSGIVRGSGDDAILVAQRIIIPTAVYRDPRTGAHHVRVRWQRVTGGWEERIVDAVTLADSRRIVAALRGAGAPVTSTTARAVVDWIAQVQEANGAALPHRVGCRRMGWVSDDPADGFMHGWEHIGGSGDAELVDVPDRLRPMIDAYAVAGTLRDWLRTVWAPVRLHPRAAIATYASIAAPLLALIPEASSLAVEYGAGSRTGKGVALEASLSAWAHPDRAIGRWDSTPKGIGLRGALHPSMPLVMEDSKLADRNGQLDTGKVAEVIYGYTNSGLRMRTGEDGRLDIVEPVRGVLLTAGEQAYADAAGDAQGAIARTLTLRGSPWRAVDTDTRRIVDAVRHAAALHYGSAGPEVVRWLIAADRATLERVRSEYRERREVVALGEAGTAQAAAAHVALLWTAAYVAQEAAGMEPPEGLWSELVTAAAASAESADTAFRALADVLGWLGAEPVLVYADSDARHAPPGGWAARYRTDALELRASRLAEQLARMGYQPGNVIGLWRERGWLRSGDRTPVVRWGTGTQRAVVVVRDAIPEALRASW